MFFLFNIIYSPHECLEPREVLLAGLVEVARVARVERVPELVLGAPRHRPPVLPVVPPGFASFPSVTFFV